MQKDGFIPGIMVGIIIALAVAFGFAVTVKVVTQSVLRELAEPNGINLNEL